MLKFALSIMQTPKANRRLGELALGSQREHNFRWNMGLRIDNRRQSFIRTTFHYSLVIYIGVSYQFFSVSLCIFNTINGIKANLIFWKLWILNQLLDFIIFF